MREYQAWCIGETGDPERAVRLLEDLLADAEELHEPRSILVVSIRRALAWWQGEAGRPDEAANTFRILVQEASEQRGQDDRRVRGLQHALAYWNAVSKPGEDVNEHLSAIVARMERDLSPTGLATSSHDQT